MDQQKVLYTILGMTVVTYLPRMLPAWLLSDMELPSLLRRWLRFVPVAVLSTLLMPSLLLDGSTHEFDVNMNNLGLLAALPTAVVALVSRSFLGTVVVGVGIVAAARYFLN